MPKNVIRHIAPRIGTVVQFRSLWVVVAAWARQSESNGAAGLRTISERRHANSILFYNAENNLEALPVEDLTLMGTDSIDPGLFVLLEKTNNYLSRTNK